MADNQHRLIKGYRELTTEEIYAINRAKKLADEVESYIDELKDFLGEGVDKRWLAIATTDLQKGFMALVRSIAKPESF